VATLFTKEAKRTTHAAVIASLAYTHVRAVRHQQRGCVPHLLTPTADGLETRNRLACITAVRADVGTKGALLEHTALVTACPSHDLRCGVERERVPGKANGALHNDGAAPGSASFAHPVNIERSAEDHLGHVAQGNKARLFASKGGVEARIEKPGFRVEPA
jgi:hypothetical protein